jgi:hypothetical protein
MKELFYSDITVYGFHGCSVEIQKKIIENKESFVPSKNKYDWLGDGIYFWENDPNRALDWASKKYELGAVVGAKIRLGNCFDLSNIYARQILKKSFFDYEFLMKTAALPLPINRSPKNYLFPDDKVLRFLDRAVIHHCINNLNYALPDWDVHTIRSPFQEGPDLYPNSGFRLHDHIHLCVKSPSAIIEVFDPFAE